MRPCVLVLTAVLLTSCGAQEATPRAELRAGTGSTEPSSSPGPTTRPAPDVTSAPGPPSPAAPSSAPRSSSPASSPQATPPSLRTAAQGDVDGDGEPDEITYEGQEAVVALSGGGVLRASTEADIAPDPPVTAGVEDLDRDGRAEVFVKVGQGASTGFLLVLRYDGTRLAALRTDGGPLLLAFGGAATHGDGFSCTEAGTLLVRSASSEDGEAYALQTVTYRVSGHALSETGRTTGTGASTADPEVAAAYVVDCRSVGEGG